MTEVNNVYTVMDPTLPNPAADGRLGAIAYASEIGKLSLMGPLITIGARDLGLPGNP